MSKKIPKYLQNDQEHKFGHEKRYNIKFVPMNANQQTYWNSLNRDTIIIGTGAPGVGKSYIPALYMMQELSRGNIEKVIISRPNIALAGNSHGFLPGTINEKMIPWMQQTLNYFKEFVGNANVNIWLKETNQKIYLQPLENIRGASFKNAIILIEESQQLSIEEIVCITTRIGENCKLILAGDPKQKDIKSNGFEYFCNLIKKHKINDIGITEFNTDDIVRSGICKRLTKMFYQEGL